MRKNLNKNPNSGNIVVFRLYRFKDKKEQDVGAEVPDHFSFDHKSKRSYKNDLVML